MELKLHDSEIKNSPFLQQAFPAAQFWCGIEPNWVSLIFSNEKLAPWHGGAAWIFQMDDQSPTAALLQLREGFLRKRKYLGILKRDELIAHELSHVGRMMFDEPRFEEMLAYRSSTSWLSRTFGPLLQSSKESMFFVCSLFLMMIADFIALFYGYGLQSSLWFKFVPAGLALFAICRLIKNKTLLNRALEKIKKIASETSANAILYRLTDREIVFFASASLDQVRDYIDRQEELRWQVIRDAYLKASA